MADAQERAPRRVWLIGEQNPYGNDPRFALYPRPKRAAGARLCTALGLTAHEYLRRFERRNLLGPVKWSAPVARAAAQVLLGEAATAGALLGGHVSLVLCGAKVSAAFGLPFAPLAQVHALVPDRVQGLVVPHPSGLSRLWNQKGMALRVRAAVEALTPLPVPVAHAATRPRTPYRDLGDGVGDGGDYRGSMSTTATPPTPTAPVACLTVQGDMGRPTLVLSMPGPRGGTEALRLEVDETGVRAFLRGDRDQGSRDVDAIRDVLQAWHRAWVDDAVVAAVAVPADADPSDLTEEQAELLRTAVDAFPALTQRERDIYAAGLIAAFTQRKVAQQEKVRTGALLRDLFLTAVALPDLAAFEAMVGAVTPGDWRPTVSDLSGDEIVLDDEHRIVASCRGDRQGQANARAIATLRNAAPALVTIVRALGGAS